MTDDFRGSDRTSPLVRWGIVLAASSYVGYLPSGGQRVPDSAGLHLRELTDYVYRLIMADEPPEP